MKKKQNVCKKCGDNLVEDREFCYGCTFVKKAFPEPKQINNNQAIEDQLKAMYDYKRLGIK